jgi:hypothetical protein
MIVSFDLDSYANDNGVIMAQAGGLCGAYGAG